MSKILHRRNTLQTLEYLALGTLSRILNNTIVFYAICAESKLDGLSGYYNHVSVEEYVIASRELVMCRRPRKLSMESDGVVI